MKYTATRFHTRIKTVGANVVIVRDNADVNNIRYLVVLFKAWNSAELKANCGNLADAMTFAHSC